jgi:hypothetical protein
MFGVIGLAWRVFLHVTNKMHHSQLCGPKNRFAESSRSQHTTDEVSDLASHRRQNVAVEVECDRDRLVTESLLDNLRVHTSFGAGVATSGPATVKDSTITTTWPAPQAAAQAPCASSPLARARRQGQLRCPRSRVFHPSVARTAPVQDGRNARTRSMNGCPAPMRR